MSCCQLPLRAVPPSQVGGASSVVAGLTLVLGMVPLCSYVRVQRLKGIALASSLPSTVRTTWSGRLSAITRLCRPTVLLTYRALDAEPEDLLVAFQSGVVGIIPPEGIVLMVPFSQESFASRVLALCKGWVLDRIWILRQLLHFGQPAFSLLTRRVGAALHLWPQASQIQPTG